MAGGRDMSRGGKGGVVSPQSKIRRWKMGAITATDGQFEWVSA